MDSLIYNIAKSLNIPDFLFGLPNFYEQFSNWYFNNFHYWEFILDDPVEQEPLYNPEYESEIEWHLSDGSTGPYIDKDDQNIDEDLFDSSDNISDTGSDYSLYWYNSD